MLTSSVEYALSIRYVDKSCIGTIVGPVYAGYAGMYNGADDALVLSNILMTAGKQKAKIGNNVRYNSYRSNLLSAFEQRHTEFVREGIPMSMYKEARSAEEIDQVLDSALKEAAAHISAESEARGRAEGKLLVE